MMMGSLRCRNLAFLMVMRMHIMNTKTINYKEKKTEDDIVLDSEDRNVYELFEDILGECDTEKSAIFERVYRLRYDEEFESKTNECYAINRKEQNNWLQRVQELQYQRMFDSTHMILFHASARFDGVGLGDSEEHRRFVQFSADKRQEIKKQNEPVFDYNAFMREK